MSDTKTARTPRNAESITKGALSLPMAERVALKKELQASIDKEVADLKAASDEAEKIAAS
jgi:hypothetical protein